MKAIRSLFFCAAAAFAAAHGTPAWAQRLDAQLLKVYGGNYSSDCGNASAPRLRVVADALMVEQGNKRLTGKNVQAAHSYFGQSPPPDYQVALLGEVRGEQLIFLVYRDKAGQYITIDGDTKVRAALGKALLGPKYRSCNPAQQAAIPNPPSPAPQKYSETEISAPGLLADPRFKSAYYKALGTLVNESWLAKLDGPSPTNKKVKVAGTEYLLAGACKDHDCADNNIALLYSSARGVVYGKVYRQRRSTLIGAPPPAIATELERLWQAEWRQNR